MLFYINKLSEILKRTGWAMLLVIGFVFLFQDTRVAARCTPMESQHAVSIAPTLEMNTLEFPDEHILPIGFNVTIICTSNASKETYGSPYHGQPYWVQYNFNDEVVRLKDCGGRDGDVDSEDSKVCTFSIQNATQKNSGNYTCWAYNQMTCTKGTWSLEFREPAPPSFTINPVNEVTVSPGSKVTMTCEATGIPRPVVKWYKDGLSVSRKTTVGVKGVSLLSFESVRTLHQGIYWCEARNVEGWKRSSRTRLVLKRKTVRECNETFFYLHPKSVTVSPGDHVVFTCSVKGCSVPKITWLKNGLANVDEEGKSYQGQENATSVLTIDSIEIRNSGNYSCQATSSKGNITSREAVLIIKGDTSHSTGVSMVVWISITITAVLLVVLVVLVFFIHKECRKANIKDQKEMSEQQRFPHLHIHEGAMNQPLTNSNAYVAPHFQMTRMTVGNGTRVTTENEE